MKEIEFEEIKQWSRQVKSTKVMKIHISCCRMVGCRSRAFKEDNQSCIMDQQR